MLNNFQSESGIPKFVYVNVPYVQERNMNRLYKAPVVLFRPHISC